MSDRHSLRRAGAPALAYRHRAGAGPTVVFLPGYKSDMTGDKAEALDAWAAARGRAYLRFDYSGCGASEGRFDDGTISRWTDDALAVVDAVAPGPLVLVGSSMGGWIALLVARALPDRVRAVVTVAAAPDFTDWGITDAERAELAHHCRIERPSDYGEPYGYSAALVADGAANRLLAGEIAIDVPVRLLHGQADADVPWVVSLDVADRVRSADVEVVLVKDGDHRLSRRTDLDRLCATLDRLETVCAP